MKTLTAILLFVVISFPSVLAQEDIVKTFDVKKGERVIVDVSFGNVTYSSGNFGKLKITAHNILTEEKDKLRMRRSPGTVFVEFRGEDSDDFYVEVEGPAEFDVNFKTGGGNVKIKNDIKGSVKIKTGGGNIQSENVFGKVDATTAGGNIKLGDVSDALYITTAGGDIKLGNIKGRTNVSTSGGNIKIGNISSSAEVSTAGGNISVANVDGDAKISTAGGNIKVDVVSGSAQINTAGGNINLLGSTGKVEVNTGAGNLNLKNIKGSAEANTGAGNIYAELLPDGQSKSEFNTGVGNITLVIPSTANATVVAKANVMMWANDKSDMEQIESDFTPVSLNKNKNEMQIEATYKLNDGGSIIELNVHLGKIRIRKPK